MWAIMGFALSKIWTHRGLFAVYNTQPLPPHPRSPGPLTEGGISVYGHRQSL